MSSFGLIKSFLNQIGMIYVRFLCASEYRKQTFTGINERPIEFAFLFRQLTEFWPKTILDVGTGITALPHLMRTCGFLVTAIDNRDDYWPAGMTNRHFHILHDDITKTALSRTFDFISCISVLEHIQEHGKAMKSMFKLLNPGGRLILTCPYTENRYIPNVYELPESSVQEKFSFSTQSFSRQELSTWLVESPFELEKQEFWKFFEGDYWTCGERLQKPIQVARENCHQMCCLVLRKPSFSSLSEKMS